MDRDTKSLNKILSKQNLAVWYFITSKCELSQECQGWSTWKKISVNITSVEWRKKNPWSSQLMKKKHLTKFMINNNSRNFLASTKSIYDSLQLNSERLNAFPVKSGPRQVSALTTSTQHWTGAISRPWRQVREQKQTGRSHDVVSM
jgi:hypothetical protein